MAAFESAFYRFEINLADFWISAPINAMAQLLNFIFAGSLTLLFEVILARYHAPGHLYSREVRED